jgi:transposase
VRATWAPKGKTPILAHRFNWKRLSMAAALAYAPDGSDATLVFSMQPGSYNDESLMDFLTELHDLLDGDKVTLVWDGLTSHRSRAMQAFVKGARRWLVVERLPPYGHDLNPVEQVWGNVKGRELANLCPDSIDEAARTADSGLLRISADAGLCFAFLRHCGLSL